MNRLAISALLFQLMVMLAVTCTTGLTGGDPGGSEITNGKVAAMNGTPASGLTVAAYPEKFIVGQSGIASVITAVTDGDGAFELPIDSGLYNVFVVDTSTRSGCLVRDVGPNTGLGTIRLDALGSIEGIIRIDSAQAAPVLIVYSRGTPLRVNIASSDGTFRFERVPSGTYTLSIAELPPTGCAPGIDCGTPGAGGEDGKGSVTVESGATAVVDTLVRAADIGPLP
jgi:hypothetical protein